MKKTQIFLFFACFLVLWAPSAPAPSRPEQPEDTSMAAAQTYPGDESQKQTPTEETPLKTSTDDVPAPAEHIPLSPETSETLDNPTLPAQPANESSTSQQQVDAQNVDISTENPAQPGQEATPPVALSPEKNKNKILAYVALACTKGAHAAKKIVNLPQKALGAAQALREKLKKNREARNQRIADLLKKKVETAPTTQTTPAPAAPAPAPTTPAAPKLPTLREIMAANREINRKAADRAKTKDEFGNFSFDAFNKGNGLDKDVFADLTTGIDPTTYFKNRTNIKDKPDVIPAPPKVDSGLVLARETGVNSTIGSRALSDFTLIPEWGFAPQHLLTSGLPSFLYAIFPEEVGPKLDAWITKQHQKFYKLAPPVSTLTAPAPAVTPAPASSRTSRAPAAPTPPTITVMQRGNTAIAPEELESYSKNAETFAWWRNEVPAIPQDLDNPLRKSVFYYPKGTYEQRIADRKPLGATTKEELEGAVANRLSIVGTLDKALKAKQPLFFGACYLLAQCHAHKGIFRGLRKATIEDPLFVPGIGLTSAYFLLDSCISKVCRSLGIQHTISLNRIFPQRVQDLVQYGKKQIEYTRTNDWFYTPTIRNPAPKPINPDTLGKYQDLVNSASTTASTDQELKRDYDLDVARYKSELAAYPATVPNKISLESVNHLITPFSVSMQRKWVEMIPKYGILAALGGWGIYKYLNEPNTLLTQATKEFAEHSNVVGIKYEKTVPREMRGHKYLMLDRGQHKAGNLVYAVLSKAIRPATRMFAAAYVNLLHGGSTPPPALVAFLSVIVRPIVTMYVSAIARSLHAQTPPAYILESELALLTPKTREAILQAAYSERITKTMFYSYTIGQEAHSLKKPTQWIYGNLRELHAQAQKMALEVESRVDELARLIAIRHQNNTPLTSAEREQLAIFLKRTNSTATTEIKEAEAYARWLLQSLPNATQAEKNATWDAMKNLNYKGPIHTYVMATTGTPGYLMPQECKKNIEDSMLHIKAMPRITANL